MRRRLALAAAVLVAIASTPLLEVRALADGPSPWIGVWAVSFQKSSYDPKAPPFKRQICTIQEWEGGLRISYDIVANRGGVTHLEWTGKFDGVDYVVQGMDTVMTNAYKPVGDRSYEIVVKIDGQTAAAARTTLSPDGRAITTVNGRTTTVFEKQGQ